MGICLNFKSILTHFHPFFGTFGQLPRPGRFCTSPWAWCWRSSIQGSYYTRPDCCLARRDVTSHDLHIKFMSFQRHFCCLEMVGRCCRDGVPRQCSGSSVAHPGIEIVSVATAPGVASAPVKPDVASKFMRALRDQYIDGGNLSQFQDLRAYSDWNILDS